MSSPIRKPKFKVFPIKKRSSPEPSSPIDSETDKLVMSLREELADERKKVSELEATIASMKVKMEKIQEQEHDELSFGEKILDFIGSGGKNAKQIAHHLGVDRTTVNKWLYTNFNKTVVKTKDPTPCWSKKE